MVAFDVLGLVRIFEKNWASIEANTGATVTELARAKVLANRLITALGRREQAPPPKSETSLLRQRAFTLLVRAYAEVRHALTYIRRHHGDVDKIAPSLWAGRGKRPANEEPVPVFTTSHGLATLTPMTTSAPDEEVPVGFPPVGYPGSKPIAE
jgi:hypothetical protein